MIDCPIRRHVRIILALLRAARLRAQQRGFGDRARHQQHIAQIEPVDPPHGETNAAGRHVAERFAHATDFIERALELGFAAQRADIILHCGLQGLHHFGGVEVARRRIGGEPIEQCGGVVGAIPDRAANTAALLDRLAANAPTRDFNTAEMVQALQATMQDHVGPLRSKAQLERALDKIGRISEALGDMPPGGVGFAMRRIDWLDLRNMLLVARAIAETALLRTETRGAQQREDYPDMSPDWAVNQFVALRDGRMTVSRASAAVPAEAVS